ncbi:MAG: TetR/AcrR family transcriptional regulator [Desulfobacterales bacterium]|nr:TetR/AcrR family transcriptional regulator [Desulfobacterales bacterium]
MRTDEVPTQVKNPELVKKRRRQIVDAAVQLFIEKGFHKTTTRKIADASGISIGSLYEYVTSKEDVLYLVCDAIHAEVECSLAAALLRLEQKEKVLEEVMREYFFVCDRMSDHILLMYQETQNLPMQWRNKVFETEIRITQLFVDVFNKFNLFTTPNGTSLINVDILAHTISVLGHMWVFRRWYLAKKYTIEEYIQCQIRLILSELYPNTYSLSDK